MYGIGRLLPIPSSRNLSMTRRYARLPLFDKNSRIARSAMIRSILIDGAELL